MTIGLDALEALASLDDAALCVRDQAGAVVWSSAAFRELDATPNVVVETRAITWAGAPATLVRVRRADPSRDTAIAAHREAEERLQFLADNLPHAMIYQVAVSPALERRMTYVSRGVEHLHQVSQEAVYADPLLLRRQIHPDDLPAVYAKEQVSWRDKTPFSAEVRLCLPNGEIRWALLTSKLRPGPDGSTLWDGMEIDLTEVRNAEAERRRADDRMRTMFELFPEPTAVSIGDTIVEVNRGFERFFGWRRDEVVGKSAAEIGIWADPEVRRALVARFVAEGRIEGAEISVGRRDGTIAIGMVSLDSIELDGQAGILFVFRDYTAQARAREAEECLVAELRARNAEMEQFVYTASHDLKSPLITIRGFVGAIRDELLGGDATLAIGDLARVDAAAKRMLVLLDDLLELSRVGRVAEAPTVFALGDVVAVAVELVRGALDQRGVTVAIAPALPMVRGDRARFAQVVQNLVENAAKYMGPQAHPRIEISAREDLAAKQVTLTVRDNGIGIAPVHHQRVFGLFDKLDPKSPGTGVGLALVRRIVEHHGGRVWVESAGPGTGSAFHLTLPSASR